ncbi:MAG: hypothetical protein ACE5JP_17280 [Candidatus Bipolaricaulia bacterium]
MKRTVPVVILLVGVGVILAGCTQRSVIEMQNRETRRYWEFTGFAPGDESVYPGDSPVLRQIKACEVARTEAFAKAAETITGFQIKIEIERDTTVNNVLLENREIQTSFIAFISGLTPIETDYRRADELCTVTVRVYKRDLERSLGVKIVTSAPFGEG